MKTGLAYSIIKKNKIIKQKCEGYYDDGKEVNEDTLFPIASISKIITGMGILKLLQNEKIKDLKDCINDYISIKIINPNLPEKKITFYQLLTHTSGLQDPEIFSHVTKKEDLYLKDYVLDTFTEKNNNLKKLWNFIDEEKYYYSNAGFTLLGYIIEEISNKSFIEYIQENIFVPLEITKAGWIIYDLDKNNVSKSYYNSSDFYYQVKEYPACQLRISIKDLNKILMEFTNNEERILKKEIMELFFPNDCYFGLVWWGKMTWYGEEGVWMHGGYMDGVRTLIKYSPKDKSGYIILKNSEDSYSILDKELKNFY
jgi:hypothetical protein